MKTPVFTTVGELIAALFDETESLGGLKPRERCLMVAYVVNDLLRRSSSERMQHASSKRFFLPLS